MPFVKIDTGILDSTIWYERDCREVFLTALLLAYPKEFKEEQEQLEVESLSPTGWKVPPGWYGFVHAAGTGIVRRSMLDDGPGIEALKKLCQPEASSRSQDFDGRRLARVNGGYVVLNYMKYRDYDYTAADRMRRLRERKRNKTNGVRDSDGVTANAETVRRNVTHSREQIAESILDTTPPLASLAAPPRVGRVREGSPKDVEEVRAYWTDQKLQSDPEEFFNHYEANGWRLGGKTPMKDWRAKARNWGKSEGPHQSTFVHAVPHRPQPATDTGRPEGWKPKTSKSASATPTSETPSAKDP